MTSTTIKCVTKTTELKQILALQNLNYVKNLTEEEKNTNGFVTVKHTLSVLEQMNSKTPQIIATNNTNVVGYALVMLPETTSLIPVLAPMFKILNSLTYNNIPVKNYNYYVMGQICISKTYRGLGLFRKLYQKHKEVYKNTYNFCITEVSTNNQRSMLAHQKIGFTTIHTFTDQTDTWNILLWDWK